MIGWWYYVHACRAFLARPPLRLTGAGYLSLHARPFPGGLLLVILCGPARYRLGARELSL